MDSAKFNDWMQVIGIFALVASLIFVGYQLKQDREIAKAATYQERTSATTAVAFSLCRQSCCIECVDKDNNEFRTRLSVTLSRPAIRAGRRAKSHTIGGLRWCLLDA